MVPPTDMAPSRVVAVWNEADTNPLIRSFIEIATARSGHGRWMGRKLLANQR